METYRHTIIRNTNTPHCPLLNSLHKRLPSPQPPFLATKGGMQKHQIDILQLTTHLPQTLSYRFLGAFVGDCLRWYLCREKDFFTRDPGLDDPIGAGCFIAVEGCTVDVAVAGFEGFLDCGVCLAWGGLEDLLYQYHLIVNGCQHCFEFNYLLRSLTKGFRSPSLV